VKQFTVIKIDVTKIFSLQVFGGGKTILRSAQILYRSGALNTRIFIDFIKPLNNGIDAVGFW